MKKNKIITLILVFVITLSCVLSETKNVNATRLFTTDKNMLIGSTKSIKLFAYYGKKKPRWSTSGGKFRIMSKSKNSCKIKAINIGTGTLNCKIGKKTYKLKIKVREKNKATFSNYNKIQEGMYINEVEELIGKYEKVSYQRTHTQEEYNEYLAWNAEDGTWNDEIWLEEIQYQWHNPDTSNYIYITFHDGIVFKKQYF